MSEDVVFELDVWVTAVAVTALLLVLVTVFALVVAALA